MNADESVFIVEEDPGVRESVSALFSAEGLRVEWFASAEKFLEAEVSDQPGCLLLDLDLPGMSGLELLEQLRAQRVQMPVVLLSGQGTVRAVVQGFRLGVLDLLEKPLEPGALVDRARSALAADRRRRRQEEEMAAIRKRFAEVTSREREVLAALATGKSSKMIAVETYRTAKTIEFHRANLLNKTQAENVVHLVRMATIAGIV